MSGKRVSYEQSISSFFADDDPYMAIYQQAAKTFGDDNFVFLVYDDPALLTPEGMDRVAELAAAVGPRHIAGRAASRVARRDAASSGRSTTPCWRSTVCPGMLPESRPLKPPSSPSRTST